MDAKRFVAYLFFVSFVLNYINNKDAQVTHPEIGFKLSKIFPRPFAPNCTIDTLSQKASVYLHPVIFKAYLKWHRAIYYHADFKKTDGLRQELRERFEKQHSGITKWIEIRLLIDEAYYNLREKKLTLGESLAQIAVVKSKKFDSFIQVDARIILSLIQYQGLRHNESLQNVDEAMRLLDESDDFDRRNELYFLRVMNYNNSGLLDSASNTLKIIKTRCKENLSCLAFGSHLHGINNFFRNREDEVQKLLERSLDLHRLDPCSNVFNKSRTYYEIANSFQRTGEFERATMYYDSAIWAYNTSYQSKGRLKESIYNITLFSGKAELLTDLAIEKRSFVLGKRAYELFQRIGEWMSQSEIYDRDSYIQNKYFHNFYYSYIIKLCSFLKRESDDDKWVYLMLKHFAEYKSSSLSRDLSLNRMWNLNKDDVESSIYNFVINDKNLENAIQREGLGKLNLRHFEYKRKLLENERKLISEIFKGRRERSFSSSNLIQKRIEELVIESTHDNTLRLFYYVGSELYNDDIIHVITIFGGEIDNWEIRNSWRILGRIDSLYNWHKKDTPNWTVDPTEYAELSYTIFRDLLFPLLSQLSRVDRIHIIQDNNLHTLPFSSLVTSVSSDLTDYENLCYLAEDYDVSYGYLVQNGRSINQPLILSNEDRITSFSWSSKQSIIDQPNTGFRELPGSVMEVQAMSEALEYPNFFNQYSGYDATTQNFMNEISSNSIIHLALHASTAGADRLDSKLFFRSGRATEILYNHDLQYQALNAELVSLSGCFTNAGKNEEAEGIFSLSRAFYKAGAKRVISNLWTLDDQFAPVFFRMFYSNLNTQKNASLALSAAQRSYLNDCEGTECFPGVWAGLMLYE